jgi:anaerobic ribonucleoside-triphosphate reductase activating protein
MPKEGDVGRMAEATWIIDRETGELTVEGLSVGEVAGLTAGLLAGGRPVNCGRPAGVPPLNSSPALGEPSEPTLRVYRVYHNSVVEGPGRRSVAQLAGCLLRCPGCYVPETHDPRGGVEMTVSEVVGLVLDSQGEPRDGVTVLGGEPFLQPEGLAALLGALKGRGLHVTLYTGYTLEALRAREEAAVNEALAHADILIDGPFVAQLTRNAGEWRGSTNQRIIYRPASTVAP